MKYLNDVNRKDCVGKVFKSKSSGDFKILKYNDRANVEIQFLNTWLINYYLILCIQTLTNRGVDYV